MQSSAGRCCVLSLYERETPRKIKAEMDSWGQRVRREMYQRENMKTVEKKHENYIEKQGKSV